MTAEGRDYYSIDEVRAILSKLSHADQVKLRQIARYQASKIRNCDADDLLSEALTRVCEGRRKWPRGLEIAHFMKKVFGSIITSEAKHYVYASEYEAEAEVGISGEVDGTNEPMQVDFHPDPSDVIDAQQMLQSLLAVLSDDAQALAVAMSLAEGLKAKDAQQKFNISPQQYDAARNRLRRKIKVFLAGEVLA